MFRSIRNGLTEIALAVGFVLVLAIAFIDIPEKKQAFDLAYRCLRFGAAFAVFNV